MTGGVVTGGWAFVWAAYGITFGAFALYGFSLWTRVRREARATREEQR